MLITRRVTKYNVQTFRVNNVYKPVAFHFNTMGHTFEDLTLMVIEQLGSAPTERRKLRESFWIHTLQSVAPQGLNLEP